MVNLSKRRRSNELRTFILENVSGHHRDIAQLVAARFGVSRQAVARHLSKLVLEGKLIAEGETKGRTYRLGAKKEATLEVTPGLVEQTVWERMVRPLLQGETPNVLQICQYGFTEILNNVLDHSGSPTVHIEIERTPDTIQMTVVDKGIGIFRKIQEAYKLDSERLAIFELAKGKVTTDPRAHTGEGIFFTSRMFDRFEVMSGQQGFARRRETDDWLIEDQKQSIAGTLVSMMINPDSKHTIAEVFDRYASEQDDFAFARTHVAVAMASAEDTLVSRSQAKRVVARLERFREVVLDFKDVDSIGPAFADEIFRVFANRNPEVSLLAVNTNANVERMIQRASRRSAELEQS